MNYQSHKRKCPRCTTPILNTMLSGTLKSSGSIEEIERKGTKVETEKTLQFVVKAWVEALYETHLKKNYTVSKTFDSCSNPSKKSQNTNVLARVRGQ